MFKALWFLFKVSVFVVFMVWVAELPGSIELDVFGYLIKIELGFFLMAIGVIVAISIFIYNVITTLIKLPSRYMRYRMIKNREKGYRALTIGLTSLAAGDGKNAASQARLTRRYLKHEDGLALLLRAQAARLNGREQDALRSFSLLLENPDAAFLGARGLLHVALEKGYYDKALDLARYALHLYPKQPWILNLIYDLQLKQDLWDDALNSLRSIERFKSLPEAKIRDDRAALYIAKADCLTQSGEDDDALHSLERAFRANPAFVPAALALARTYIASGLPKKACKVLEGNWKHAPHPDVAALWRSMLSDDQRAKPMGALKWFLKLYKLNPDNAQSAVEAARVALLERVWGEARNYLKKAEALSPNKEVYRLLSELEERANKDTEQAKAWLEKARDALEAPTWVCLETGRIYNSWHYENASGSKFNTIEWAVPDLVNVSNEHLYGKLQKDVLESPV